MQQYAEDTANVLAKGNTKAKKNGTTKLVCVVDGRVTSSRLVSPKIRNAALAAKLVT